MRIYSIPTSVDSIAGEKYATGKTQRDPLNNKHGFGYTDV